MEVPVRSREDELVDLIVYAISRATTESEPPSDFGNAKIAKIVYDIAEEHELPVTRSWYMFGTYVWSNYATGERMKQFQSPSSSNISTQYTVEMAKSKDRKLFEELLESVMKHKMLTMSLSEILDGLYARAPKKYRGLYQTHRKLLVRFGRMARSIEKPLSEPQYMNAARDITEFHKEMLVFDDKPQMVDVVLDYTSFMEDLILKHDSLFNDGKPLENIIAHFKNAYDKYRGTIWTFPPSVISIETLTGENESAVKSGREYHLSTLPSHINDAELLREETFKSGLYPSSDEIYAVQSRLAPNLGTSEKTMHEYFGRSLNPSN